jgi:tetratricopeptide (TPR) repeat protein
VPRTPATSDEVGGQDEEFLFHLNSGSDLLTRGELAAASASLARARELRPRDPQVLGLHGQSLYKQGRYEEAAEAYARLVDESPVEAAARVNLGLASLKAKRHADAVRQLEVALDLNPEHKKAMGYPGLA